MLIIPENVSKREIHSSLSFCVCVHMCVHVCVYACARVQGVVKLNSLNRTAGT